MTTTSIVTSMYNKSDDVLKIIENLFFKSLLKHGDSSMQLVIVDDRSPWMVETTHLMDRYLPDLRQKLGNVVFSRNPANLGFAGSYNRGMSLADGTYVIVTNDDVYFPQGSLEALVAPFSQSGNIGIIGPVTNDSCGYQNTHLFRPLKDYSTQELERIEHFSSWLRQVMEDRLKDVRYYDLTGFCFATTRAVLDKHGAFDPRFVYGGSEDTDLNRRLAKAGLRIVLEPGTFVEHGGPDGGSMSRKQDKHLLRWHDSRNGRLYSEKWGDLFGTGLLFFMGDLYANDQFTVTGRIKRAARKQGLWADYLAIK